LDIRLRNNYAKKLLAMDARGELGPGNIKVDVFHDDRCDFWRGVGYCNCDPTLLVKPQSMN